MHTSSRIFGDIQRHCIFYRSVSSTPFLGVRPRPTGMHVGLRSYGCCRTAVESQSNGIVSKPNRSCNHRFKQQHQTASEQRRTLVLPACLCMRQKNRTVRTTDMRVQLRLVVSVNYRQLLPAWQFSQITILRVHFFPRKNNQQMMMRSSSQVAMLPMSDAPVSEKLTQYTLLLDTNNDKSRLTIAR